MRTAMKICLFCLLALPAGAQDPQPPQAVPPPQPRTAVTKENLPGAYRANILIYQVTITLRPDGTLLLADLPSKGGAKSAPLEGTWSLDEAKRLSALCKPEGQDEVKLEIDLAKTTLEELRKTAPVSLKTSALGEKALAVRLTRARDYEPEKDALAAKPAEPTPQDEEGDLARMLKALAGRCTEEACRAIEGAKKLWASMELEKRVAALSRKVEERFKNQP